jgi:glutamate-1-semialdehyde 2,1-aminomutase
MCNPLASHGLLEEFKLIFPNQPYSKTKPLDWYTQNNFFEQFVSYLSELKVLQFTGGEPFINQEMWEFIDHIIAIGEAEHIHLKFNTNFTVLNDKILNKLKKFANVTLLISLDGIENVFEYIRFPGKWEQITSNLKKLNLALEDDNTIEIILTPSIQILNIFQLNKIISITKPYLNLSKLVELNMVTQPDSFCISNLPKKIKSELKVKILSEMNEMLDGIEKSEVLLAQLKDVIRLLDQPANIEALRDFLRTNQIFDQNRKQSLKDFLPDDWYTLILEEVSKA